MHHALANHELHIAALCLCLFHKQQLIRIQQVVGSRHDENRRQARQTAGNGADAVIVALHALEEEIQRLAEARDGQPRIARGRDNVHLQVLHPDAYGGRDGHHARGDGLARVEGALRQAEGEGAAGRVAGGPEGRLRRLRGRQLVVQRLQHLVHLGQLVFWPETVDGHRDAGVEAVGQLGDEILVRLGNVKEEAAAVEVQEDNKELLVAQGLGRHIEDWKALGAALFNVALGLDLVGWQEVGRGPRQLDALM